MNAHLLSRSVAGLPKELRKNYNTELIHAIQTSDTRFENPTVSDTAIVANSRHERNEARGEGEMFCVVHHGGVTTIVIDRFEGRYLLSGGADSSVSIWDLEAAEDWHGRSTATHRPLHSIAASSKSHSHGITQLSFYPFDSMAFLSSSYDHSVKIWNSETLHASASFNLESVVYSHSVSRIASHLLVACATQHPAVRLIDLKSGASSHSLAGHAGTVLAVAWSPKDDHILASGGIDGMIRFWDIRRSAGSLASLDQDDSVGIVGHDGIGSGARRKERGKAHVGAVNGLVWTQDGRHVISTGHDERIRVWNTSSGANTLANFGPIIKNKNLSRVTPCIVPPHLLATGKDVLFFPNDREILMYEMFEGRLLKRLKTPYAPLTSSNNEAHLKGRVVDLAWRTHSVELYSAYGNGSIRVWRPRTNDDAVQDDQDLEETKAAESERKRKRRALGNVFEDLAQKRMIFSDLDQ